MRNVKLGGTSADGRVDLARGLRQVLVTIELGGASDSYDQQIYIILGGIVRRCAFLQYLLESTQDGARCVRHVPFDMIRMFRNASD